LAYNKLERTFAVKEYFGIVPFPSLRSIDLGNNKLSSFPIWTTSVDGIENINVENNSIARLPARELCQCKNLVSLVLYGNPQKTVRATILSQGSRAVIEYLRKRGGAPADEVQSPPTRKPGARVESNDCEYASRAPMQSPSPPSSGDSRVTESPIAHPRADVDAMKRDAAEMQKRVDAMSTQLSDDFSLTTAKKYALKKSLAVTRANLIRLKRAMKETSLR